jgi:DNA repair exonuclease SbcCD ATPase subunit
MSDPVPASELVDELRRLHLQASLHPLEAAQALGKAADRIESLEAKVADLNGALQAAEESYYELEAERRAWEADRDAERAHADMLAEWIDRNGFHSALCPVMGGYDYPCNCDKGAALAAHRERRQT